MKNAVLFSLVAAVAGSAFGAPLVYDYKASVKHMYLREVRVGQTLVYQKFLKSASLKGYLIMDDDAFLSNTYTVGGIRGHNGLCDWSGTYAADQGRNRGFLVVMNSSAEARVKAPKILPAVLDAKWIDTAFSRDHEATTGIAEGTLFLGGDLITPIRPKIEVSNAAAADLHAEQQNVAAPTAGVPGMAAIADYVWTSVYLFGIYNGPNWFQAAGVTPFQQFENAWDGNLPAGVRTWGNGTTPKAVVNYYHDTWLNGAGVGKYGTPRPVGELCCGLTEIEQDKIVTTLSGNLKGGIFLCTENGIDVRRPGYTWFAATGTVGTAWEDQFACCRDDDNCLTYSAQGDAWQNDMWQDGPIEQETTDVAYGTWSIKFNNAFLSRIAQELTADDTRALLPLVPVVGTGPLWACIKGAAFNLKRDARFWDGTEIYNKTSGQRFEVPVLTPEFVKYYGLAQ